MARHGGLDGWTARAGHSAVVIVAEFTASECTWLSFGFFLYLHHIHWVWRHGVLTLESLHLSFFGSVHRSCHLTVSRLCTAFIRIQHHITRRPNTDQHTRHTHCSQHHKRDSNTATIYSNHISMLQYTQNTERINQVRHLSRALELTSPSGR